MAVSEWTQEHVQVPFVPAHFSSLWWEGKGVFLEFLKSRHMDASLLRATQSFAKALISGIQQLMCLKRSLLTTMYLS